MFLIKIYYELGNLYTKKFMWIKILLLLHSPQKQRVFCNQLFRI